MMSIFILLLGIVLPPIIHELGHYAVAFYKGTRVSIFKFFRRNGIRFIWDIPKNLNNREIREILIAGFVAEILGGMLLLLLYLLISNVFILLATIIYYIATSAHLWHYAVNPGNHDDLLNLYHYKN